MKGQVVASHATIGLQRIEDIALEVLLPIELHVFKPLIAAQFQRLTRLLLNLEHLFLAIVLLGLLLLQQLEFRYFISIVIRALAGLLHARIVSYIILVLLRGASRVEKVVDVCVVCLRITSKVHSL